MRIIARYILLLLTIALGATFLYSAYTKILPIQPFEYTMVEYLHMPWLMAAIAARILVGLEAGLGGLIVLHFFGKNKWVLKMSMGLLVIFSIYLIGLWATAGNNLNCGCFGDAIWMSPSASLIKNAILLVVLWLIARYHNGINKRWANIASPILLVATVILPFILFYIQSSQPSWLRKDRYKLDFTALYNPVPATDTVKPAANFPLRPGVDLSKGKHIVAFLSQSCPHCRIAARKMHLMKKNNPGLPFFMVIGGTTSDLADFWKETNAKDIPYSRLDREAFLIYTGGVFPYIVWVNNGWVEARSTYNTMSQEGIEQWLKQ